MPLCDHDGSVLTISDCPAVVYSTCYNGRGVSGAARFFRITSYGYLDSETTY